MEIQHSSEGEKGSFFIKIGTGLRAEMVYGMALSNKLIIEHTVVSESMQGQGIGTKLLEGLVDFARTEKLTVIPVCAFAKAIFEKRPDLQDVLS